MTRRVLTAIVVLGSTMSLLSPITWTHHLVFLSLLLLYPVLSWRDRPVVSAIALAMVTVVLIDPLGAGNADSPVGSSVRALVMLAILVFHRRLIGLELRDDLRRSGSPEVGYPSLDRR